MKRAVGSALGIVVTLIGLVWAGQGLNLIGGSFMTGQTRWLVIGVIVALAGLALVGWANRGRSPPA